MESISLILVVTKLPNGETTHKMWIARRSPTKQTWPGYLDQIVAGGISTGYSMMETIVKECGEEAGIDPKLAKLAKPAGTIQYFTRSRYGLQPETQYGRI